MAASSGLAGRVAMNNNNNDKGRNDRSWEKGQKDEKGPMLC
jgi:hypothetical protein